MSRKGLIWNAREHVESNWVGSRGWRTGLYFRSHNVFSAVAKVTDAHDPSGQIENDRWHRLRLGLDANRCPGLLPLLEAAAGSVVCGLYRIDYTLAAGNQFIVWAAIELSSDRPVVLKQCRFDYRRPVQYGRADADRYRKAIRREYDVLSADRSGTLPRPLALLVGDSPLPAAAASPVLARDEVFVAE
jgi:hypothetical protein